MKIILSYIIVLSVLFFSQLPSFALSNEPNLNSLQKTKLNSRGPTQPIIPPQPAVPAKPAVLSKVANSTSKNNDITFYTERTHFIISDFEFPKNHELYIKIYNKDNKKEKYYVFKKKIGVSIDNKTIRFPCVNALCHIKYGIKGKTKPFVIDLNKKGAGLTDLPGCKIKKSSLPKDSLNIELPNITPKFNM